MIKKWVTRVGLTLAVSAGTVIGISSPALAGDTHLILSDRDGRQVAHMVHVDDGDVFKIYDDQADGYGPTGYLQIWSPVGGYWVTLKSRHNGAGDGNPVTFQYDVLEGLIYRMKLCHEIAGCSNQPFNE